jgi:phosphatidylinositol alpha-1,6-mannosyltransferase
MQTVFNKSDLVIACSDYSLRLLKEKVPACDAIAIPLAVDHVRFTPGNQNAAKNKFGVNGKHVLCSVSRIRAYKGHDVVFQALANLPAHLRDQFIYLIVGRGQDQIILQSRANEEGVGSLVRWLNYIPEDDLPDIYRAADLFVLCTREVINQQEVEGFGLVFLEAQACGTPVVGTRTGGIPDAIKEGEGGWLIDQDDTQALTRILLKLAETPEEFKDAGIKARARIERDCTWDHYLDQFISVLETRGIQVG